MKGCRMDSTSCRMNNPLRILKIAAALLQTAGTKAIIKFAAESPKIFTHKKTHTIFIAYAIFNIFNISKSLNLTKYKFVACL